MSRCNSQHSKADYMLTKENGFKLPIQHKFADACKYAFPFISLFIILMAVYSNSFYGEWHYDDFANIVENPHVQMKSFSWPEIKECILGIYQDNLSRPLSYLSFGLNYRLGGMDVFGFHVFNFIIHYLSSLFLFLFIYNTLRLPLLRDKYSVVAYSTALLATVFWAIHPLFVTSVTYIVQRMASMAGMFYILSMYLYLKARTTEKTGPAIALFSGCCLAGLASFLTKENAAMLPVSIVLFDLILIQGVTKESIKRFGKIIVIPLLIVFILGLIYTSGFSKTLSGYAIRDFSIIERLLTEPRVIIFYLTLLFYPIGSRLTLIYDVSVSRSLIEPWTTIPSILLVALLVGLAISLAKKRPLISFCILFYFLNHLVEGSVIPLELIYEHRNYLPAMLIFIPLTEFIIFVLNYFSYKKAIQFAIAAGVVAVIIAEGDVTYNRNQIVSDDFLLWTDNIQKSPELSRPYANLGRIYYNHGDRAKAFQEYEKAMQLDRFGNKVIRAVQESNLGLYYFEEMKDDLAMDYFKRSSKYLPDYIYNITYPVKIKLRQNRLNEALQMIEDKCNKYPDNRDIMQLYSLVLLKSGEIERAQKLARKSLIKDPDSVPALTVLAEACRIKSDYACALMHWESIQKIAPQNAFANLALIDLYTKTKDTKRLNHEIRIFYYLKGASNLDEYIKSLTADEKLLIYIPQIENYSFMKKKCTEMN